MKRLRKYSKEVIWNLQGSKVVARVSFSKWEYAETLDVHHVSSYKRLSL
jgi:hypothetical protein